MDKPVEVTIDNFQSISHLEFKVDGFTCITGPTNIGKSAIMRAMSGAMLNKPVVGLVRNGERSCSVRFKSFDWGFLWEKSEKGLNRYTLDGKPDKLENVGQRQPDQISEIGFGCVRIGDRDLYPWYASQWMPLFLLNESGPAVTEFISKILNLDILQDAIGLGLKAKKKTSDEAKIRSGDLEKLRQKESAITALDGTIGMVDELKAQSESIKEYEKRIVRGTQLKNQLEALEKAVDKIGSVSKIQVPPDGFGNEIETYKSIYGHWISLELAAKKVLVLRPAKTVGIPSPPETDFQKLSKVRKYSGLHDLQNSVKKLEPVRKLCTPGMADASDIEKVKIARAYVKRIAAARAAVDVLSQEIDIPTVDVDAGALVKAKKTLDQIEVLRSEVSERELSLKTLSSELKSVMKELQAMPSCPTCGRPMPHQHP